MSEKEQIIVSVDKSLNPHLDDEYFAPVTYSFKLRFKIGLIDCGTSGGDCLIRCFQTFKSRMSDEPCPSSKSFYESLRIEENVFLEDVSIPPLCRYFECNALLICSKPAKDCCVYYPMGFTNTICIYNLYPIHYVLINNFSLGDELLSIDDVKNLLIPYNTVPFKLDTEYLSTQVVFHDSTPEPDILTVNFSNLYLTEDFKVIYSYLMDVNLMVFPDVNTTVNCFYHTHNLFTRSLLSLNSSNLYPPRDYLKAYYKFRHNTFASICRFAKMPGTLFKFETDESLKNWIDSNKTPDMVYETEDTIYLYEFTVGNTYEKIDFYKGGGNFTVKYTEEAKEISETTGKLCKTLIVPCVLEVYNIQEIFQILDVIPDRVFQQCLEDFMNTCNADKGVISGNYFHTSPSACSFEPPLIPGKEIYDRPRPSNIVLLPADFLSSFSKARDFLKNKHVDPSINNYKLYYNIESCRMFLLKDKRGMKHTELIDKLWHSPLSELLSICRYQREGKEINIREIRGTVPITLPENGNVKKLKMWDYVPFCEKYYDLQVPRYRGNYGELEFVTDDNLNLSRFETKVNFPPDYLDRLFTMDVKPILDYKGNALLSNCKVTFEEINDCIDIFNEEMDKVNQLDHYRPKPTFLIPLVTCPMRHQNLDVFNQEILEEYLARGVGNYTKYVLKKVKSGLFATSRKSEFSEELRSRFQEYHNANSNYFNSMYMIEGRVVKYKAIDLKKYPEIVPLHKKLVEAANNYRSLLGESKSVISDRLVKASMSDTVLQSEFYKEIQHYTDRSGREGLGMVPEKMSDFSDYLTELIDRLFIPNYHNMDLHELFDNERGCGPEFLTKLKNDYGERFINFYNKFFRYTLLEQICVFYERVSKFLFNESVKTYNSSYVKVDNLGYDNIIILCRGGPKIYKGQRSRMYKIMFFSDPKDTFYTGYQENNHFEMFNLGDKMLVVTPWSQTHQDVLFDYMSLSFRTFNQMYSIYTRANSDFDKRPTNLMVLPFILSLHNRRKTEKLMHNCRYLIVNPLGFCSNLTGIIKTFTDVNYTYLDSWLRWRISLNYSSFARVMLEVRDQKSRNIESVLDRCGATDLWFGNPISNSDLLTLFIYSTYMMSKAPVNSSIEQANNLWEILEDITDYEKTHPDVNQLVDDSLRFDVTSFDPDIYQDDFKYDPVFCQYLGHYMFSYLKNSFELNEIDNYWNQLRESDFSSIANSNGLRGWKQSNFFGKKGYQIVYDKVMELFTDDEIVSSITAYLESDHMYASEMIRMDRVTNSNLDLDYENLIFHIVHKIQRGGGREIFCMDLNTKALQNPIEKLMKYMCKRIPNEFISIPSNKRHGIIHSDFYEKPVGHWVKRINRWVLDCRRWAPHSVFQKYVHFLTGMAPLLPPDFLEYFNKFSAGMFKKQFVTREHVISKMKNNDRFKPFVKHVNKLSKAADALCMTVQFSFVMGIFNYLSTLMHAANQLVASEVIRFQCLNQGLGLVVLDPKCHSDDSVVTSYHENEYSTELSIKLYDWLLKGGNHMLNLKKSQVNSNIYLEFLSTLYLFDRFLPVFPKFTSTIPFKPTDDGYGSDLSFAVSQCIELMVNGGNFEEAFLMEKTTSKFIQLVYSMEPNYKLPPQWLGNFDSHPIEFLYSGSESELIKYYLYNKERFWVSVNFLCSQKLIQSDSVNLSFNWDMGSFLPTTLISKMGKLSKLTEKLEGCEWTLENCHFNNSRLGLIWYVKRLSNRKFRSSLLNEPVARRYSRIFGSVNYRNIRKNDGSLVMVKDIAAVMLELDRLEIPNAIPIDGPLEQYMDYISRDLKEFYDSIEGTTISGVETSNIKDKPIVIHTGQSILGNIKIKPTEYVSYVKEPNGFKLLGSFRNPRIEVNLITEHLKLLGISPDVVGPNQLNNVVTKLLTHQGKVFRLIAPMKGDSRNITTLSGVLKMIEFNTYSHHRVVLKNRRAQEVDWERKIKAGKMPQTAKDYISCYWVCRALADSGLQDLDIYTFNPFDREKSLSEKLDSEWKHILLTSIDSENLTLSQMTHWIYWEQEQKKIGRMWYGSGCCYVKIPEAVVKIQMLNGTVSNISLDSDYTGNFSISSSWFLHNLFHFSGINVTLINADFGLPNQLYIGYSTRDSVYGVGRSKGFDYIIEMQKVTNLLPAFCFQACKRERVKNHYIYHHNNKRHYIDFFVPTEDPVKVNFKGIFDLDKIKENKDNKDLMDFITNLSIDLGGLIEIDKEYLLNNLWKSTLYKVVYENNDRRNISVNNYKNDYFVNSLIQWKRNHPKFGFPTEEELDSLMKDENTPPFPRKVFEALFKLGKSNISDTEFENIILQMFELKGDDRMQYLLNNYQFMDNDMAVTTLVVSMRSQYIFDSCFLLGFDTLSILSPLISLVTEAINKYRVLSPTLNQLKKNFQLSKNLDYQTDQIFKILMSKLVMDGFFINMSLEFSPIYIQALKVWTELTENGLQKYLNFIPTSSAILRSADFTVGKDKFLDWVQNLILSHCVYNYKRHFKFPQKRKDFLNNTPEIMSMISEIRGQLNRFNPFPFDDVIEIQSKNKEITQLRRVDGVPGFIDGEFFVPTEDGMFELDCGYNIGEVYEEDVEPDPDAVIDLLGYVVAPILSWFEVGKRRGAARKVFIGSFSVSNDILKIHGEKYLYKKVSSNLNLYDYLESTSNYILLVSDSKCHYTVKGYKLLTWEEMIREIKANYITPPCITIDGKKYERSDVLTDSMLQNKIIGLNSYFKKINKVTAVEELESIKKKIEVFPDYDKSGVLAETHDKLLRMLDSIQAEEETSKSDLTATIEKVNISQIMEEVVNFKSQIEEGGTQHRTVREYFARNFRNFEYQDPMTLLTDTVFRSEFNTLFPGYLDRLLNREIRLSAQTKKRICQFAEGQILRLQRPLKPIYRRLLLCIKAVLTLTEECRFRDNEDFEFAALIDDYFLIDMNVEDTTAEEESDLIPNYTESAVEFDLAKILK